MSGRNRARVQALERDAAARRAARAAWLERLAEELGTDVAELEERGAAFRREAQERGVSERELVWESMRDGVKTWHAAGETLEDMLWRAQSLTRSGFPEATVHMYEDAIQDAYAGLTADEGRDATAAFVTSESSERQTGPGGQNGATQTKPERTRVRIM